MKPKIRQRVGLPDMLVAPYPETVRFSRIEF